jgi:hypothetical protein
MKFGGRFFAAEKAMKSTKEKDFEVNHAFLRDSRPDK